MAREQKVEHTQVSVENLEAAVSLLQGHDRAGGDSP
jgi:hypothetical protein